MQNYEVPTIEEAGAKRKAEDHLQSHRAKKIYSFISQQESITLELMTVEDDLKFFILPFLNTVESITVKDNHSRIDRITEIHAKGESQ